MRSSPRILIGHRSHQLDISTATLHPIYILNSIFEQQEVNTDTADKIVFSDDAYFRLESLDNW